MLRQHTHAPVLALALGLGCIDAPEQRPLELSTAVEQDPARDASVRTEAFVAAPSWPALLELLGRPHADARALLGPHHLRYTAQLSTGPAGLPDGAALPTVPVGQGIAERFAVTDQLELRWAAAADEPVRLHLDQHNEHESGRALIVIGDRCWTALDGREWFEAPVETEIWQLWADDAQHAVFDLVELAGPHADIDSVEPIDVDGRPAVRVTLRPSEGYHRERIVEAISPWREAAEVDVGAASIVLDRATGLWLGAQIELRWRFVDKAGREVAGLARFDGRVEIGAQAPKIEPPAVSAPVPERERLELLRERMLDGLAGP
jgi:hypothetical protein